MRLTFKRLWLSREITKVEREFVIRSSIENAHWKESASANHKVLLLLNLLDLLQVLLLETFVCLSLPNLLILLPALLLTVPKLLLYLS